MNSIVINGLTFTSEPPTKEGWWLWVVQEQDNFIEVGSVHRHHRYKDKLIFTSHLSDGCLEDMTGFWHELISKQKFAQEVKKAYFEGFDNADFNSGSWSESKAKRIVEDKE